MTAHDQHFVWFFVGYITVAIEGFICLHACHASPHGVRCTWPDVWRQLCYRREPRLPRARIHR